MSEDHEGSWINARVATGVDSWLRWAPKWRPGTYRGRARMCRRCTGSPILVAAGIAGDVPHEVAHALTSRMQRIIDRAVDEYTERELPQLYAELSGEQIWNSGGFEPGAGLDPEYDGVDLDPENDEAQPFLFTMAGLAEETQPPPPLPRPPLSPGEKRQLRREIEMADQFANDVGQQLCIVLSGHKQRVVAAVERFVEPQVQAMMTELTEGLEPPRGW